MISLCSCRFLYFFVFRPNRNNFKILLLNFDFESSTCEVEDVKGWKIGAQGQADSVTERP